MVEKSCGKTADSSLTLSKTAEQFKNSDFLHPILNFKACARIEAPGGFAANSPASLFWFHASHFNIHFKGFN